MRTKFKKWAVDYLDESFTNQIKLDDFNKEDFLKLVLERVSLLLLLLVSI